MILVALSDDHVLLVDAGSSKSYPNLEFPPSVFRLTIAAVCPHQFFVKCLEIPSNMNTYRATSRLIPRSFATQMSLVSQFRTLTAVQRKPAPVQPATAEQPGDCDGSKPLAGYPKFSSTKVQTKTNGDGTFDNETLKCFFQNLVNFERLVRLEAKPPGKYWTRVSLLLELISSAFPVAMPGFEPRTCDMRGELVTTLVPSGLQAFVTLPGWEVLTGGCSATDSDCLIFYLNAPNAVICTLFRFRCQIKVNPDESLVYGGREGFINFMGDIGEWTTEPKRNNVGHLETVTHALAFFIPRKRRVSVCVNPQDIVAVTTCESYKEHNFFHLTRFFLILVVRQLRFGVGNCCLVDSDNDPEGDGDLVRPSDVEAVSNCASLVSFEEIFSISRSKRLSLTGTVQCQRRTPNNGERNDGSVAVVPSGDSLVILIGRAITRNS
ncbi:hypothetical protein CLF_112942 [Clonorchis sinensis]|uniref:Uncharacterized protein n=1 Tax=Clonorchis sinensis TaxID=79923 RepID=G7YXB3_CLOSI|nr:hypothetical protein CLF_112942 [Clonorchis sinensis]